MSHIVEKYYKVANGAENEYIKASLYYKLGGTNVFTYEREPRGYYVSVAPVKRENKYGVTMESFMAFSGYAYLAKEVTRQSKKAEKEAVNFFNAMHKTFIKQAFPDMEIDFGEETK